MSGEIELLIDEIVQIAKDMQGYVSEDADTAASAFQSAKINASAFADIPPGMEFFTQQQAAHQVFVETIKGVVADLQQFGETLQGNAENHRAVDESNADTLTAYEVQQDQQAASQAMGEVNQDYGDRTADGEGLAAEQAYDESRQGNEALDVQTEHDAGAEPQGAQGVQGAPGAPPADPPAPGASDGPSGPPTADDGADFSQ